MDIEVLKSYLVSLGFAVNQPQLRTFDLALKDAAGMVESRTVGVLKDVFKWQAALTGAFTGVAAGVVAMADHVAMADQKYRLLGLRMFMTQESARKLSIGLDALGASLEEIAWDPELHAHFLELADDQDRMAKNLGGSFAQTMRSIRDLRFEFTRLKVAGEYLSMQFVAALFQKLGLTVGDVQSKLEDFVRWFEDKIPAIAGGLADDLLPILKDTWQIVTELGVAFAQLGLLFTNVVGVFSGDQSIEGTEFSFRKLAGAVGIVADDIAALLHVLTSAETMLVHFADAAVLVMGGRFADAKKELLSGLDLFGPGTGAVLGGVGGAGLGGAGGATYGATLGSAFGPLGTLLGGASGGILGTLLGGAAGAGLGAGAGEVKQMIAPSDQNTGAGPLSSIAALIASRSQAAGLNPQMAEAVARQESGERQFDKNGNVLANPGSSARGVFQLLAGTAKGLGVDRNDTGQNIT
ncbi:MAG: hypothetical protein M3Y22_06000, partial [Pseudomonadota bacterium]|nr:hypothetical protein [Pseudomonadota bacterium]